MATPDIFTNFVWFECAFCFLAENCISSHFCAERRHTPAVSIKFKFLVHFKKNKAKVSVGEIPLIVFFVVIVRDSVLRPNLILFQQFLSRIDSNTWNSQLTYSSGPGMFDFNFYLHCDRSVARISNNYFFASAFPNLYFSFAILFEQFINF